MFKIHHIKSIRISIQPLLVGVLLIVGFSLKAQSLEELKTISAENNLDLKAQYKSFKAQLENVMQAKSWQDPNLSFGYFISPIETRVGPQIAKFSLTQMLPWFGTFKARGDVAAYRAEAEYEKFQNQKLKLFLEVAKHYYELAFLSEKVHLEDEQIQLLADVKLMVESHYENDKAKMTDILRIELEIDELKTSVQVLEDQKKALVSQLNQLMNRPTETPIVIDNPRQILENTNDLKMQKIAENHPRLEKIQRKQEANEAEKELAKKQAMPQFGFGLDYAIIQNRNVRATDAGQDAIIPTISISLPIFGKKNRSRKKQAQLKGESLQFQLENEKTRLETEIEVAQYKKEELLSVLDLYNKQLESLKDILQLAEVALANDSMDIEEVLRLEEERLLYQKQKAETLADLQKNKETLDYLTLK